MLNLFKIKPTVFVEKEVSNGYPEVVEEIHRQFHTASDRILQEAKNIIETEGQKDIQKGERLSAVGFGKTKEAVTAKETAEAIKMNKAIADTVLYYMNNYPSHKFITEQEVDVICKRYGLVCGDTTDYIGFVPEKNLRDIENKPEVKKEDFRYFRYMRLTWVAEGKEISYVEYSRETQNDYGFKHTSHYYYSIEKSLKICAPVKDFDMRGKELKNSRIQNIPDPIVLQPVRGGYLIVTAWGDEASDELVVNQQMN